MNSDQPIYASLPAPHAAILLDFIESGDDLTALAAAHGLDLIQLLLICNSPPFIAAIEAIEDATARRISTRYTLTAATALASLAADASHPMESRRAAIPLLRFLSRRITTTKPPRAPTGDKAAHIPDSESPLLCRIAFEPIRGTERGMGLPAHASCRIPDHSSDPPSQSGLSTPASAPTSASAVRTPLDTFPPLPNPLPFPRSSTTKPGRPTPASLATAAGAGP